jgi:hypothetical protein
MDALVQTVLVAAYWKGSWACELCAKDDDAETKMWQEKFAAYLAQTGGDFAKVTSCTIVMTVSDPTMYPSEANADITVDCGKGINMNTLGFAKGTFLARVLQRSFAKVHGVIPSDDFTLTQVSYGEVPKTLAAQVADEDEPSLERRRRPPPPSLTGSMICRMCGDGTWDLETPRVNGAAKMAWQAELVAELRKSSFAVFRKVTQCTIKVLPSGSKVTADEDADFTAFQAPSGLRGGTANE